MPTKLRLCTTICLNMLTLFEELSSKMKHILLALCICFIVFTEVKSIAEFEEFRKNATEVIKQYIGTFSNVIGTDLWIWVGIAAGGTFILCLILWAVCSCCYCLCSGGAKKRSKGRSPR
ncbi:uncharacterized protein LOC143223596 isoform X2 [Tachypleus tridentatus]|uniref:uncharacterized protein LOC143223596 isoform X2 n=1 Tax=Tachypleus tridentatus TaxID=6853 RepID=UPI003FD2F720